MKRNSGLHHYLPRKETVDHETATRMHATECYLLGDFSIAERDEFEAHLADCIRCMDDLAAIDNLAANAQAVFQDRAAARHAATQRNWLARLGLQPMPVFAFSAALNLFLIAFTGYGLLRFVPALQSRLHQSQFELQRSKARLRESSVPGVSQNFHVRGILRGGQALPVLKATPFVSVRFDLPQHHAQYSYSIDGATRHMQGPAGAPVPANAETLELIIPTATFEPGDYLLKIIGSEGATAVEIASCILRVESKQ